MRWLIVGDAIFRHDGDHLTTTIKGRHGREKITLAIENANAGRPVNLMPGEDIEISIKRAHINRQMHCTLRTVDQNLHAMRVGNADDLFHWRNRAEHIRHMRDRHHLGAWRN